MAADLFYNHENMKSGSKKAAPSPLEGSWNVMTLEVDGQPMASGMLAGARIVVEGDRFQSLGMGEVYEGKVKVDSSASPKAIDMTFTKGPEKGNTSLGIYELDGDDWRLCLTMRGGTRPKTFATAPGTGLALETLKRGAAPAAVEAAAEEPAGAGAPTELEGEWSMVSGFMDGQAADASMVKYGKRVTRGNETVVKFGPQVFIRATFTLDAGKSPREIDLVHSQGMHKGKTQLGIYECDGQFFRYCASTPGQPRPTDFEARKGDGKTIAVWKLEKR